MKKYFFICAILFLTSCEEEQELTTVKGDFIYYEDAAVILQENDVFGLKIDARAKELAKKVEKHKEDEFDMVPVEVKGVIHDNPNKEGWDKIIEVREIINIASKAKDPIIKETITN